MNERIRLIALLADKAIRETDLREVNGGIHITPAFEKFARLIVRECLDKIETYHIPVGNSAAGEMACEMTYSALMEIRDEIREHFGVEK